MRTHIHMQTHVYTHVYIHECVYMRIYAYVYTYMHMYMHMCMYMCMYPPTPFGVERVRPATITNNHPPSPISQQGTIHHLVRPPDTEPCLLGQSSNQPTNITNDQSPSRTSGHLPLKQPINQPTKQPNHQILPSPQETSH